MNEQKVIKETIEQYCALTNDHTAFVKVFTPSQLNEIKQIMLIAAKVAIENDRFTERPTIFPSITQKKDVINLEILNALVRIDDTVKQAVRTLSLQGINPFDYVDEKKKREILSELFVKEFV